MAYQLDANGGILLSDFGFIENDEISFSLDIRYTLTGTYSIGPRAQINFKRADGTEDGLVYSTTSGNPATGHVVGEWFRYEVTATVPAEAALLNVGFSVWGYYFDAGGIFECRKPMLNLGTPAPFIPVNPNDFVELGKFGGNRGGYPTSSGPRTTPTASSVIAPNGTPYQGGGPANLMPPWLNPAIYASDPFPTSSGGSAVVGGPFNYAPTAQMDSGAADYRNPGGYFPAPGIILDATDPNSGNRVAPDLSASAPG